MSKPSTSPPAAPAPPSVADRLATLPKYYDWRALVIAFDGWDLLLSAYCAGLLPDTAASILEDTALARLHVQLLRRQVRLLQRLLEITEGTRPT